MQTKITIEVVTGGKGNRLCESGQYPCRWLEYRKYMDGAKEKPDIIKTGSVVRREDLYAEKCSTCGATIGGEETCQVDMKNNRFCCLGCVFAPWKSPDASIETLAAEQGVKPVQDISALALPEDMRDIELRHNIQPLGDYRGNCAFCTQLATRHHVSNNPYYDVYICDDCNVQEARGR